MNVWQHKIVKIEKENIVKHGFKALKQLGFHWVLGVLQQQDERFDLGKYCIHEQVLFRDYLRQVGQHH
jgi:hypothetical protein